MTSESCLFDLVVKNFKTKNSAHRVKSFSTHAYLKSDRSTDLQVEMLPLEQKSRDQLYFGGGKKDLMKDFI